MDGRVKPGHDEGLASLPPGGSTFSRQQLLRVDSFLLQLIEGALAWRLVRPPAQDRGAVTKSLAAEMVVGDFDDQLRLERTPLRRAIGRPSARAARGIAGKSGFGDQRLKLGRQR